MSTRIFLTAAVRAWSAVVVLGLSPFTASAQDPVSEAKNLYASADYDEALKLLAGAPESRDVFYYRALCLVGLDRNEAAEEQLAAVVMLDPLYKPDPAEVSPRVINAYNATRRRLLPQVVRTAFTEAKRLFQTGDRGLAREQFDRTMALLDDPLLGENNDLSDLKLVAAGFRELASVEVSSATVPAAVPEPARASPAPESPTRASAAPVISVSTPAIALQQALPSWRPSAAFARQVLNGEVQVEIDASGRVTSARMAKPLHPEYDALVLTAARDWSYKPATRNGVAVSSVTVVPIQLRPQR